MAALLLQEQVLNECDFDKFASGLSMPTEEELAPYRKTGVNICVLAYAATEAMNNCAIPRISYMSSGSWNKVFLLKFPDGINAIARIPFKESRIPLKLKSEVATMTFARYHCGIPCPKVLAWNSSENNLVGAPYILMERAEGVSPGRLWSKLSESDRHKLLDNLAKLHARFARPLPFSHIGSIFFSPSAAVEKESELGTLSLYQIHSFTREPTFGVSSWNAEYCAPPSTSLRDFWDSFLTHERSSFSSKYGNSRDTVILQKGDRYRYLKSRAWTMGDFLDAHSNLRTIVSKCVLPRKPDLLAPCLISADYAFRNIFVDRTTLEVTSVLDWDSISVMPFVLCTRFPEDIAIRYAAPRSWVSESGGFDCVPSEDPPVPGDGYDCDVESQAYRQYYKERLRVYDERFTPELWRMRKDPLKIQYLVTNGWVCWLQNNEWLEKKARMMAGWRNVYGKVKNLVSFIITRILASSVSTSE